MLFKKLATASVVAVLGLGVSAVGASAYSISGGAYAAVSSAGHSSSIGGAYTIVCDPPTFSGSATGSATTSFTPAYANCDFFGHPAEFTLSGAWELTVIGGSGPSGPYYARVDIPTGVNVTTAVPLVGCEIYNAGPQSFVNGVGGTTVTLWNTPAGLQVDADVYGIGYTTNGACPFVSGTDGEYHTNGSVIFPGVTVG